MKRYSRSNWALILGGSSGMGLAAANRLATEGMSICIVHRDRKAALPKLSEKFERIRAEAPEFISFNLDALACEGRATVLAGLKEKFSGSAGIRVLLHSIAIGNLGSVAPREGIERVLGEDEMGFTLQAMGYSLLPWVQGLHSHGLFAADARVIGLTSEGSRVALPGYGAVAMAKAALEALCRTIAVEFASHGIRCNVLQPGITDTPALRMVPGSEELKRVAESRNPFGRLTTPEDVAAAISMLASDEAAWINGAVIRVDGGEAISGGRAR